MFLYDVLASYYFCTFFTANGFTTQCISVMCLFRMFLRKITFPHSSQENGLTAQCISGICLCRMFLLKITFPRIFQMLRYIFSCFEPDGGHCGARTWGVQLRPVSWACGYRIQGDLIWVRSTPKLHCFWEHGYIF